MRNRGQQAHAQCGHLQSANRHHDKRCTQPENAGNCAYDERAATQQKIGSRKSAEDMRMFRLHESKALL
jgi:hypothetical protein